MHALDNEMAENEFLEKRDFWRSKQSIKSLYGTKFNYRRKVRRATKKLNLKIRWRNGKKKKKNIQELPEKILNTFIKAIAMSINKSGERTAGENVFSVIK